MLRPVRRPLRRRLAGRGVLSGCGGGPSDTEQVHADRRGLRAGDRGQGLPAALRRLLAPKLVQEVEQAGLPCEVALKQGLGDVQAPTLTIGAIKVDGDTATAEVQHAPRRASRPRGTRCSWQRVGDSWRIASLR